MVEEVIRLATQAPDNLANPVTVIDIGTGSGAIIISTASELRRLYPRLFSRADFLAVEISRSALAVAKINARRQELAKQIKFYHGDLLTPLKLSKNSIASQRLIITANLPYLTPSQIKHSPSICREPRLALAAGSDGLKYYRQLFKQLTQLKLNNIACHLLLEIDPGQKKSIKSLAKQYWPAASVKIKNDLSGRARLVILTIEV
jgi:release factor glutamine methyltransferase